MPLGRIAKGVQCSVTGCGRGAIRSVSAPEAKMTGLEFDGRRAYLCEEHYKEYKKGTRRTRMIEKWRRGVI